ncbi:MAG TPA: hypothetical protein VGR90_11335 [Acidimicrobiales bacterium]|nr:hypothetical protein [Acidimicrobiales bacterium]
MTSASVSGGFLKSEVRAPEVRGFYSPRSAEVSAAAQSQRAGSIHDDAVAQRVGFRGGTIAGSIHMDQFPPVLVDAFGPEWFETGSLSLTFRNATISAEPVVALVAVPDRRVDVQVEARTERPDGTLVAAGTAGVGQPAEPTHLHSIDLRPADPKQLRILSCVEPGLTKLAHRAGVDSASVRGRVDRGGLLDALDWYTGPSPWGGPIAHPSALVQLLRNRGPEFGPHTAEAVGLFGAIEIRHLRGPVFLDQEYEVEGEVVAVGASPKTEYLWYDTRALDGDGRPVASMRMQLRWMTASSPLYAGS